MSQPIIIVPIEIPEFLYLKIEFTNIFEAPETETFALFLISYNLHKELRFLSQKKQSAAPPAIVPNKYEFISITFFTLGDPMKFPIEALESTEIIIPARQINAKVVVPCETFKNLS